MVKEFKDDPNVIFADANMDESAHDGQRWDEDFGNKIWQDHVWVDHHGWPSIRHYSKKTGRLGRAYVKKSGNGNDSQRTCTELGPEMGMLRDYIEEAGNTLLCKPSTPGKGCTPKEVKYVDKVKDFSQDQLEEEIASLQATFAKFGKLKESAKIKVKNILTAKWVKQKFNICSQLVKGGGGNLGAKASAPKEDL